MATTASQSSTKSGTSPKQNLDYWETVFQTGKSPSGIQILAAPLDCLWTQSMQHEIALGGKVMIETSKAEACRVGRLAHG